MLDWINYAGFQHTFLHHITLYIMNLCDLSLLNGVYLMNAFTADKRIR